MQQEPLVPPKQSTLDRAPRCRTDGRHRLLAEDIRSFVKARGHYVSRASANWAEPLALMERGEGSAWDEIVALWEWYRDNYAAIEAAKPGRLPRVSSAKTFRALVPWIRDVMNQEKAHDPLDRDRLPAPVRDALEQLEHADWPAGAARTLPAALKRSYENLESFRTALERADLDPFMDGVRDAVLATLGYGGSDYLVDWFDRVRRRSKNWPAFGGDLLRYCWCAESVAFAPHAREAAARYCGDPDSYDRLLELCGLTTRRTR